MSEDTQNRLEDTDNEKTLGTEITALDKKIDELLAILNVEAPEDKGSNEASEEDKNPEETLSASFDSLFDDF